MAANESVQELDSVHSAFQIKTLIQKIKGLRYEH